MSDYYESKENSREWLAAVSFFMALIALLILAVAMIVNWLAGLGGAPGIS